MLQSLDLDRPVHVQVGARPGGRALEPHVHRHGAVDRVGIEPHHVTENDPVACVDRRLLADRHVLRLRLGDLEHGLELPGLDHLGEHRPAEHVLAELQRQVGDHARVTRPHLQRPQDILLELRDGAQSVHLRPLDGELGVDRFGHERQPLLLDAVARFQLHGLVLGQCRLVARYAAVRAERLRDLSLALRVEVLGAGGRDDTGLGQTLILEVGSLAHQLGACCRQLLLGLEGLDLHIGVGKVEQHGFGLHVLPGLSKDTIHPAGGESRDEPDMLGHERAGPADLTHHLAAAHRIDPERAPVHRRCRGLEAREENREQHDCAGGDSASHIPAIRRRGRAGNVQVNPRCRMSPLGPCERLARSVPRDL